MRLSQLLMDTIWSWWRDMVLIWDCGDDMAMFLSLCVCVYVWVCVFHYVVEYLHMGSNILTWTVGNISYAVFVILFINGLWQHLDYFKLRKSMRHSLDVGKVKYKEVNIVNVHFCYVIKCRDVTNHPVM